MNGATIHSTSPKRYSLNTNPVAPEPGFLSFGRTSNAPPPSATRGGSAGEPKVTCAVAGSTKPIPSTKSVTILARLATFYSHSPPLCRALVYVYPKVDLLSCKQNRKERVSTASFVPSPSPAAL